MESKHTKGNFYKSGSSSQYLIASEETGNTIAVVYSQKDEKEAEANAALLAAAPDMLEALINLHDWCVQFTPEYPAALLKAKEAIIKATNY